ncbi:hypothetical protein TrLO_g973 [Triparma laevis f. longispina]|uniref:RRM domain-containing protein n=1 Tax=Triparma laevis f. longispina TaxID=1714387 RepID=A0A9W7L0M1_9STRA|nr:hypothetical protein TrLO_g973 [Triparma laevis f. longispina]
MTTPPPATQPLSSSRLIFKNLPPKLSKPLANNAKMSPAPQGTILAHIASKFPSVSFTDIFFPKLGASKTCFVGIKDEGMGKSIKEWFDGSYVESCKVKVEYARAKEVEEGGKHSNVKFSNGKQRQTKPTKKDTKKDTKKKEKKTKTKTPAPSNPTTEPPKTKKELEKERMKQEYIGAMLGNKGKVWSNDDGLDQPQNQAQPEPENTTTNSNNDSDSDSDGAAIADSDSEDDIDIDPLKNAIVANATSTSDMDFLKSKKVSTKELDEEFEKPHPPTPPPVDDGAESSSVASSDSDDDDDDDDDDNTPTNRLFVRNLPYNCTENSLKDHFQPCDVEVAHIPIDGMGRSKGFGFVTFKTSYEASEALQQTSTIFEGRNIGLSFAKPDKNNANNGDEEDATYKEKKEKERKANAGTDKDQKSWSASYVNSDSVAEAVALKLGVTKGELFDVEASGVAAKMAVAEVEIVKEIEQFFSENGYNNTTTAKSPTDILLKNIPHNVTAQDILKTFTAYGTVEDVFLPGCGCAAIIRFKESTEARKAFRRVAYGKFWGRPVYLEWAVVREGGKESSSNNSAPATKANSDEEEEVEDQPETISNSLFVKNLNFSTGEDSLSSFFERITPNKVLAVKIPTKVAPFGSKMEGQTMSMGFGFVEFKDKSSCSKAMKEGNGGMLDGHVVEVKRSDKSIAGGTGTGGNQKTPKPASQTAKKIMVRNLPFEASKPDILQLFGNFGKIKKATIPKKFDGTSRGFAFVEYQSAKDAREAMEKLKSTHLYGRHLVLEWSEDKDGIDDLRNKAKRDVASMKNLEESKAKKIKGKHTMFE